MTSWPHARSTILPPLGVSNYVRSIGKAKGWVVHMTAQTPAERALARSYTTGDDKIRFNITDLSVDHHPNRSATLTYWLTVGRQGHQDERWVFTLPWSDKSFVDVLTSPVPDPDRLRQLVQLVRSLLEEWWDTKDYDRQSAKMGRQLP